MTYVVQLKKGQRECYLGLTFTTGGVRRPTRLDDAFLFRTRAEAEAEVKRLEDAPANWISVGVWTVKVVSHERQ